MGDDLVRRRCLALQQFLHATVGEPAVAGRLAAGQVVAQDRHLRGKGGQMNPADVAQHRATQVEQKVVALAILFFHHEVGRRRVEAFAVAQ